MIDIGANLGNSQLRNRLPELLISAKNSGLSHIIVTGTDLETSREAVELCHNYNQHSEADSNFPKLACTVGSTM